MRESLFFSSIRSFFLSFFAIMGLFFGVIITVLLLSLIPTSSTVSTPDPVYTPEIFTNAEGLGKKISNHDPVILKLNITGIIGENDLEMDSIRTLLRESREGFFKEAPVKAILLNINSPGGTVVDANGIYRSIKTYKEHFKIPVFAYVDGLCASGGMYIAAAADKIYASDVSLIGSVGVISPPIFNFSKTMEKLGIEALTLSEGIGKDDLNSFRPWNKNEGENYKKIINSYYQHFVNILTSNREKLSKTKLIEEYGAHIFTAKEAEEKGYIDKAAMSLSDTIKELKELIGIKNNDYQVVELNKADWVTKLFGAHFSHSFSFLKKNLSRNKLYNEFDLESHLSQETASQFLYLYRPGLSF